MTAGEAAKFFANLPPDMPVVIRGPRLAADFVRATFLETRMRKTVCGGYCRFMAPSLQHRNDTPVIMIE